MPLRSIKRRPGELPGEDTGFVGRDSELDLLGRMLRIARLVTVTGQAGVGKTRITLRAAAAAGPEFADGVCFVELAGLRDGDLVANLVAAALGLPEQDARANADAIADYLSARELLLVLDTCEHLIGECGALAGFLLREAPGLKILTTTRQPLDLPEEHVYRLPPLPVPRPGGPAVAAGSAVELFAARAATALPGFVVTPDSSDDVIRLCQRLDGIPLAIELAAVQLRTTPLKALTSQLNHRFLLLAGGRRPAGPHQQTLRTATQWSYDLCTPAERLLWARLSVFAGSFSISAAEEVCGSDRLHQPDVLPALIGLVDKSVVLRSGGDEPRYRLLDTIREFGSELLAEASGVTAARERHIGYFQRLAADFGRRDKDASQLARFREMRSEHPNIRAALGYALGLPGHERRAARLATDLRPYWEISGLLREGSHWQTKILARLPEPSPERARLRLTRGVLATFQGELLEAITDLDAAAVLAQEADDAEACALAWTYLCLAFAFCGRQEEAAAAGAVAQERLEAIGHVSGLVSLDIHLGYHYLLSGAPDRALERCAQGLDRLGPGGGSDGGPGGGSDDGGSDGGERWARGYLLVITALARFLRGQTQESAAAARESLRMKHELGDIVGTAYCLEMLAIAAAGLRRWERAAWLIGTADALWERTGKRLGGNAFIEGLHQQAADAARQGVGPPRYDELIRAGANHELDAAVSRAISDADKLRPPARRGRGPGPGRGPLTSREREIAMLAGEGLTSGQIARRLNISVRTVDTHLARVYPKLGISTRVQLAHWAGTQASDRS